MHPDTIFQKTVIPVKFRHFSPHFSKRVPTGLTEYFALSPDYSPQVGRNKLSPFYAVTSVAGSISGTAPRRSYYKWTCAVTACWNLLIVTAYMNNSGLAFLLSQASPLAHCEVALFLYFRAQ